MQDGVDRAAVDDIVAQTALELFEQVAGAAAHESIVVRRARHEIDAGQAIRAAQAIQHNAGRQIQVDSGRRR